MTDQAPARSGRLAFGPWWLLYIGPVRPTRQHAHRAYQLIVHAGVPFVVDGQGQPKPGPVVVVEPGEEHAFSARRDHVLIVYVDPASAVGARLQNRSDAVEQTTDADAHPVWNVIGAFRPDNWSRAEEVVQRVVGLVCDDVSDVPMTWWRHPVIDAALHRLRADASESSVSIEVLADEVGISADRLEHLFTTEVGMPVRAYVGWMRLVNAVENLVVGASMPAAAKIAGFPDSAHFSAAFRAMFGMAPQDAIALGSWLAP